MKHFIRYIAVTTLLCALLIGTHFGSSSAHASPCLPVITNYPTFGYDMARTSFNTQECILSSISTPSYVWSNVYSGQTFAAREGISTYQSYGYIGLNTNMVSYKLTTGGVNWTFSTGATISGAATVHLDRLYFGSQDQRLYSLDPSTGSVFWVTSVGVPISSTPAAFEKLVIVSMDDGAVYAFDAFSGSLVWNTHPLGIKLSSPAVFDKKVYVSALVGTAPDKSVVYALDVSTGAVLWNTPAIPAKISAPVLANKQLYVSAENTVASVYSFDPWTGSLNWQKSTSGEPVQGKPAVDTKQVYVVGAWSGRLYGLDAYGSGINWVSVAPFAPIYTASSPTVANGVIYVGSQTTSGTGWFYAFKTSGAYIWNQQVRGVVDSPVTVINGWFYGTTITSPTTTSIIYGFKG